MLSFVGKNKISTVFYLKKEKVFHQNFRTKMMSIENYT